MLISKHTKSHRLPLKSIEIQDKFWNKQFLVNNSIAIFYQWDQLEKTHNQDNFRILAGEKEGYRIGFFYCDSDLHKWADAAARILTTNQNKKLSNLIQEYIDLIKKVQQKDGYLFTYNQFHFANRQWANLQIEHELYCLGHMIEAAVSYMETNEPETSKIYLLEIAKKAADLLVDSFQRAPPYFTPGHEEIEIALIRLYRLTQETKYLDLAAHFINQRGKITFFGLKLLKQHIDQRRRKKQIKKEMISRGIDNDIGINFDMDEMQNQKEAPFLKLRSQFQFLTGRYHQQNSPVRKMRRPYGHAVRWGYLVTAMAMLYQEIGDISILKSLLRTWEHLIQKQMFITGGIGALGYVEGFGRDYELNSEYCYCETCAAIANVLLNWELALITNEAKFSDLLEWQLYNAVSVGIGLDGKSYLYRNLLESEGQLTRKYWFATPCCPSNISRLWATIGQYIYSHDINDIWIHQYIGNNTQILLDNRSYPVNLIMSSQLPWEGKVQLKIQVPASREFTIFLRIPSWTENPHITINGDLHKINYDKPETKQTGSGFSPNKAIFYPITRLWNKQTDIELTLPMKIVIHKAHPKVKSNKGKIALSRGPIVYCFESLDNQLIQIPKASIDLSENIQTEFDEELFNGVIKLLAKDKDGNFLTAIPYYCWANRGLSAMLIWIHM